MRALRTLLLTFAALTLGFTAARAEATRVVFVTHGQAADQYWSVVKRGADDAAKTLGVNAEYRAPETFDMPAMARLLDAAIASKPDGLVVSIPDTDAIGPLTQNAVAAGIPVIVIDSGGAELSRQLGALLYGPVRVRGQRLRRQAGQASAWQAVCANHEVRNISLDDRCAGFAKGSRRRARPAGVMDPVEMKAASSATSKATRTPNSS
jgi:simple sugar transport system substrate-binding protein